ncbi:MAG: DUF1289 domain-containing protein [Rhodocyclaceae bacterium]|nr:MAG: DUF1289 domain-containing protein [Rhodocyclaceae bacterium]
MSDDNPCVGICQIDESGYCIGCGRSADEIFGETDSSTDGQDSATDSLKPVAGQPADQSD